MRDGSVSPKEDGLPATLGPYRIEEPLGAGGMGSVYRAWDARLRRHVAVKRLHVGSLNVSRRLLREARAAAALDHPAIVQIFDVLDADDEWIVMELVKGPRLADLLRAGPLEPRTALELGRQVAEGIAAAHASGILHRDLKTENVMVAPGGRAKVLDFGIALPLSDNVDFTTVSTDEGVIGTFRAMSPEQARGLQLDARSDLFAFGVLLYEMVTATSPFQADSTAEMLRRICVHRQLPAHSRNAALPAALSELIDQLLEKSPDQRPASAEEVVRRLTEMAAIPEALAGVPRPAEGPRGDGLDSSGQETVYTQGSIGVPETPAPRTSRRRPALALAAVAAGVLIASVATWEAGKSTGRPASRPVPREASDPWQVYRTGMGLLERFDRQENVERAIELFEALIDRQPDHAAAHAGLAYAYWRASKTTRDPGWLQRAEPLAERAVQLDPHLASARVSLGLVRLGLGQLELAQTELEEAVMLSPANAEAHRGLGELHQARGQNEAAERFYRRAIELEPENRRYHDLLGTLLHLTGRYDEAEAAFRRSIELAPGVIFGYRNLGAVYYLQDRLDEAAEQFQKALEIQPDASLYSNLGTILFAQGHTERSIEPFRRAVALADVATYWANLGDAYRASPGFEAEAREAYQRAAELGQVEVDDRPGDADASSRVALYLAKGGRAAAARETVARIDDLAGQGNRVLFRVAVVEELCGHRARALTVLAAALDSGYPLAAIEAEPELSALRDDPAFPEIVAEHRRRATSRPP